MTLKQATAQLAGLAYTGITSSYDLNEMPTVLYPTDLPALVIVPEDHFGDAAKSYGANNSYAEVRVSVVHMLLLQAAGDGRVEDRYAGLLDAVDAYITTLKTDARLNDNLLYPLAIRVTQFGQVFYGGVVYIGAEFLHDWIVKI